MRLTHTLLDFSTTYLVSHSCGKIVAGYEHFANAGSNAPKGSEPGAVCPLWEDTGARHYEEVEAARLQAERIAREHPGITEEELSKLRMQAPGPPPARLAHFARRKLSCLFPLTSLMKSLLIELNYICVT